MSDEAKATKAVAKTIGKAIDASREFGGFISTYISGSIEQGVGIFEDKLKYIRWDRQARLMLRTQEFMNEIGLQHPEKPIQMKLAIPFFQGATLEDDDYIQDLWAKLLVNVSNKNSNIKLKRTYIDILERLTYLEAIILEKIYSLPFETIQHAGVIAEYLPDKAVVAIDTECHTYKNANYEVLLALVNLARLGCVYPPRSLGGGEIYTTINPTVLGKSFVEACTLER